MIYSIMFPKNKMNQNQEQSDSSQKVFYKDLGLDIVFNAVMETKRHLFLRKYYYEPLQDIEIITYRQEVMQDLEKKDLRNIIIEFTNEIYSLSQSMDAIRIKLSSLNSWDDNYLVRGRMLDFSEKYCVAIHTVQDKLNGIQVNSKGILGFKNYLNDYVYSKSYQDLDTNVKELRKLFSEIEYAMLINGGTIKVRKLEEQKEYANQIFSTFNKFAQGNLKDYRQELSEEPKADHVEVAILNLLSKIYKKSSSNYLISVQSLFHLMTKLWFNFQMTLSFTLLG